MMFSDPIEITFRFAPDMPWMRMHVSSEEYLLILSGVPYKGLTCRQILTESFDDDDCNTLHMIWDSFEKIWYTEFQDANIEST